MLEDLRKRHAALEEAIDKQTIGPLQPKSAYSFALLHAAIIRRLLAENERLALTKTPGAQPIERIYPKRFEIIIDLNLEYPGGRAGGAAMGDRSHRARQRASGGARRRTGSSFRERPTEQPIRVRPTGGARHSKAGRYWIWQAAKK